MRIFVIKWPARQRPKRAEFTIIPRPANFVKRKVAQK